MRGTESTTRSAPDLRCDKLPPSAQLNVTHLERERNKPELLETRPEHISDLLLVVRIFAVEADDVVAAPLLQVGADFGHRDGRVG